jgi:hypothetical protein
MGGLLKFELLRQFPLRWSLWWIVVPNLAIIAMWPIGGPAMASTIFYCGLIALLVSQRESVALRMAGILAMFVITLAVYITKSFNLGWANALRAGQYVTELSLAKSPEYFVAIGVLLVSIAVAMKFAARTPTFGSKSQYLLALAGVSLLVNIDTVATAGTRGGYKESAPAGTPIDSAVLRTGITPDTVHARNLVVILVESWGVPDAPLDRQIDRQVWSPERWAARYSVTRGSTAYYGSTTNAEVRELCGAWADHNSYDFDHSRCLPERFREAGFATHSFHAFEGTFFDRETWYPKIGFDDIAFGNTLRKRGAHFCDGVFAGACDFDIAPQIGATLRANPDKRNFVYWLTLNSHLPVDANKTLGSDRCRIGPAEWRADFPMLCRSYQVQKVLADSITKEIMRPDFPDADILIVGDHMPPFFPRSIRTRFDTGHVPYYFLRHRSPGADRQSET